VPLEDDVLPLMNPIVGTSGKVYTELPIPKRTPVTVSAIGYNLCVPFTDSSPPSQRCTHIIVFMTGTRMYGVQMLTNSDRSVG